MKLRMRSNSLRLRITQPEMARLITHGSIEETTCFGPQPDAQLTYALEHRPGGEDIRVEYRERRVSVVISTEVATRWAHDDEVGIYGSAETGRGTLELKVEKDFACLGRDDIHDVDAFPNPGASVLC